MEVWPENWPSFQLFDKVKSQWRVGMKAFALDYSAVYPLLDRLASSREEWDELFDDIRHMERAALDAMKD